LVAPVAVDPLGLATIDQDEPFHNSVSVDVTVPVWLLPVAAQNDGPLHDTPRRALALAPVTAGVVTIVHAVPFHCSTSAVVAPPVVDVPTASQLVALEQETAFSSDAVLEGGTTGVESDQVVPFHCCARSTPACVAPTAAQKPVPTQDTPCSDGSPVRPGVETGAHVVPFHCSMTLPSATEVVPTATQNVDVVQETACS
jgi:hypothetical protein